MILNYVRSMKGLCNAWKKGVALGDINQPLLCVAGVGLRDMDLHSVWQAWDFVTWTFILCGRRGTSRHQPLLCVTGVGLRDMDLHSVWQAWDFVTWTFILCGRRGTS